MVGYNQHETYMHELHTLSLSLLKKLNKAISCLSKGDELIVTQLDRAFLNKKDCLITINKLMKNDVTLRTISGFLADNYSSKINSSIFNILYELDNLEDNYLLERK